jgi:hypothetical protein
MVRLFFLWSVSVGKGRVPLKIWGGSDIISCECASTTLNLTSKDVFSIKQNPYYYTPAFIIHLTINILMYVTF